MLFAARGRTGMMVGILDSNVDLNKFLALVIFKAQTYHHISFIWILGSGDIMNKWQYNSSD